MKAIKYFALAAMLAVGVSASAQFTTGSSSRKAKSSSSKGWNTFYVEYNPVKFNVDQSGADDESMTAFTLGYGRAFAVSPSVPVIIETGVAGQYTFKSDFLDVDDADFSMISAKVPISLGYDFNLNNGSVSIIPFVGAFARFNISGKLKYSSESIDKNWSLFDKKDMQEANFTLDQKACRRFQLGWHIGAKVRIANSFLAGFSYGSDFSEFSKKIKISTWSIILGYTF